MIRSVIRVMPVGLLVALASVALAQQAVNPAATLQSTQPSPAPAQGLRPNYVLGPNDQILIRAFEIDEINEKPFRIESDGTITLPLIAGPVKAAGLTVQGLESDITNRYKTYVKDPHISISVIQFRSEPVFFVGAFQKPGIYPLEGRRTLVEMLTSVGLQPNASRRIKVTRRAESGVIPLPNAVVDTANKVSTVEISMGSLRENINPAEDIVLEPYDTVSVARAELVYVQGGIAHVAAFELGERESISVLQAITLAGGFTPDADPTKAEILRPVLETSRRAEIHINLMNVLATKTNDVPLLPNDVLYIPTRKRNAALQKAALIAVPLIPTIIALTLR